MSGPPFALQPHRTTVWCGATHHYFEWNNPGFAGIHGYEEYLRRQTADVGVADAGFAARRETQPIGTPDEIIDKITTLQKAISLEMLVVLRAR